MSPIPNKQIKADMCIIGAGSGGLSVAAAAAQMGARTVLIERGAMGGDCLNTGCVPSKALLAAAHHAHRMTAGGPFGIEPVTPKIDFKAVHDHVHRVIAAIAPNDSVERFEALGVRVIKETARFTDAETVRAGTREIKARRFVIATGSSAAAPPIPGLDEVPYLTNETIFDNDVCPEHLLIIGGGPIGMEMAQAHRRLGARVTVLEAAKILAKDDPELAALIDDRLRREGVEIWQDAKIIRVARAAQGAPPSSAIEITAHLAGETRRIAGSHLLVAVGRSPNVEGLGLEAAGIDYSRRGIHVDDRLRTTNKKIFAIGDVVGGLQFTHVANYHAGIVIRNALFRLPARVDLSAIPWVTYTDPELAHVGETEAEAKAKYGGINVLRWPLAENDRAQAEHRLDGLVKVVTDAHGRILGATIVGPHAGDLIQPWVLAKAQGLRMNAMAGLIAPYPTLGEINKRVAGAYYTPTLFGRRTRLLVRFLGLFG